MEKKDENLATIPESTKNIVKEKKELEPKPEIKPPETTIPQEEIKKPRYFPPRKLPNPFESAA